MGLKIPLPLIVLENSPVKHILQKYTVYAESFKLIQNKFYSVQNNYLFLKS